MSERRGSETPLWTLMRVLRQRALLVVLCTVLVPAVAYFVSASQEDEYTAAAKLLFTPDNAGAALLSGSSSTADPAAGAGSNDAGTSLDLASLRTIAHQTAAALGPGFTTAAVDSAVEVVAQEDSNVVDIVAIAPSAKDAARVANAYAVAYVNYGQERLAEQLGQAISRIEEQAQSTKDPEGKAELTDRASELKLLEDLQTGGAEVVQRAQPPGAPTSPRPIRTAALGFGFGLLLGIGLALGIEMVSRRLNDPREVELVYDSPILGVIPRMSFLSRNKFDPSEMPLGASNAFQGVRTSLRYYNDYNIGSAMVISSAPEEGKTTVAWNLAVAAAESGAATVLLEADMRLPSVARRVEAVSDSPGLRAILSGDAQVEDVVQHVAVSGADNNGGAQTTLDVIVAGAPHSSPTRLIESQAMEDLILDLEERYDLVVIDTPPALVVSDAISLMDKVGGVIIVSRVRRDTQDAASHLKRALDNVRAPILGIVINGVSTQEGLHGYGYGYDARDPVSRGRQATESQQSG